MKQVSNTLRETKGARQRKLFLDRKFQELRTKYRKPRHTYFAHRRPNVSPMDRFGLDL